MPTVDELQDYIKVNRSKQLTPRYQKYNGMRGRFRISEDEDKLIVTYRIPETGEWNYVGDLTDDTAQTLCQESS